MYKKSLETIGYFEIIQQLENCAITENGKKQIRDMQPFLSESALRKSLRDTTQARALIEFAGLPPLPSMEQIEEIVGKAVLGELLLPKQLEQIGSFLNSVRRLKAYLIKGEEQQIGIAFYSQNLSSLEELQQEIERCIRSERVDDYASGYLKDIRKQILFSEEKMTEKAERSLNANKAFTSDSFVVKRNGRLCIPIKKEYRNKVNGSVVEKSSTGFTLFIEPQSAAELREELEGLRIEEDSEERRILYSLMNLAAEKEVEFRENIRVIGTLDYLFAKGKLSLEMDAVEPRINLTRRLSLTEARHPMLKKEDCVPLNLEMGNGRNGIIITGPNTGGKTVALKTVALLSAMACSGLHIPCRDGDIAMNCQILCDIGDGQDLSSNLSTFSSHIKNVLEILKRLNQESLVIMDELGSGTDPAEGMGIAMAILEELRKSGALFLVTTHYPEVKEYAARHGEIQNARMEFDKKSLRPLYKLCIGESGESCALYIARQLGMPVDMLEMAAREAYGDAGKSRFPELEGDLTGAVLQKIKVQKVQKQAETKAAPIPTERFHRGDCVTVLPDQVLGIVVAPENSQGTVVVQVKNEKFQINHKRLKLKVAADQLYPEDYDFSIIFDSVENRKLRHKMGKRHVEGAVIEVSKGEEGYM